MAIRPLSLFSDFRAELENLFDEALAAGAEWDQIESEMRRVFNLWDDERRATLDRHREMTEN